MKTPIANRDFTEEEAKAANDMMELGEMPMSDPARVDTSAELNCCEAPMTDKELDEMEARLRSPLSDDLTDLHTKAADALSELRVKNAALKGALEEIRTSDVQTLGFYHRNGPAWTGKDGHEYESTANVLSAATERLDMINHVLPGSKANG